MALGIACAPTAVALAASLRALKGWSSPARGLLHEPLAGELLEVSVEVLAGGADNAEAKATVV